VNPEWCGGGRKTDNHLLESSTCCDQVNRPNVTERTDETPDHCPQPTRAWLSQHPSATPAPLHDGEVIHVNDDINVLALVKGKERYIFLYDDAHRADTLRMLGRHASNPELSFSWYDAAVLSQKIRAEERAQRKQASRLGLPQVSDTEELF
jgi:hypothetical protein